MTNRRRKPSPPVRTGPTRSTFDGCAVTALFVLAGVTGVIGGALLVIAALA
jgi:hypothetical protein